MAKAKKSARAVSAPKQQRAKVPASALRAIDAALGAGDVLAELRALDAAFAGGDPVRVAQAVLAPR